MKIINTLKENYLLVILLFFAAILRLYHLDFQSLWMDEIYTMNVSSPSFTLREMHHEIVEKEGFPYMYFVILRALYAILGYSEFTARLLSAVGGIAGIYAIYVLGKQLLTKNVGLLAALFLTINDLHIFYSQEARPYSLYVLFVIIAFYRLSVFIKVPTLKNAVWYGLAAGLMLNINFFALITLFSQGLILLLLICFSPKDERLKLFKYSVLAGTIAIVLFVPNYQILQKLMGFESFWLAAPQADSFTLLFREFFGTSEITMFIYSLLFAFYFITIFRRKQNDFTVSAVRKDKLNYSFIILFVWFMSFFAIVIIKTYSGTSLVLHRYFISIMPVLILIVAISIHLIKNIAARYAVVISLVFLSLFNHIIVKNYYNRISKTQYREVTAFIKQNNTDNAPVYTSLRYWYKYYMDKDKPLTNLNEIPFEDLVYWMMKDSTRRKPFWYADAHGRPFTLTEPAKNYLEKYFIMGDNFEGSDAWTRYYNLKTNDTVTVDTRKFGKLKAVNGDEFKLNLEGFQSTDKEISAAGWCFFENQASASTKIALLLIKDDKVVEKLQTKRIVREDVTKHFDSKFNLDSSGFNGH